MERCEPTSKLSLHRAARISRSVVSCGAQSTWATATFDTACITRRHYIRSSFIFRASLTNLGAALFLSEEISIKCLNGPSAVRAQVAVHEIADDEIATLLSDGDAHKSHGLLL